MNDREMLRLAKDPAAVRARARTIKELLAEELNDKQLQFLLDLETFAGPALLSIRRREWLDDLWNRAHRSKEKRGFRAATLIHRLWELRSELSDEEEAFVEQLEAQGFDVALSDNQWRFLLVLCRRYGEIEGYIDIN
jgi:hypothetical protein